MPFFVGAAGAAGAGMVFKYVLAVTMSYIAMRLVELTTDLFIRTTSDLIDQTLTWFGATALVPPSSEPIHTYLPSDFLFGDFCLSKSLGGTQDAWMPLSESHLTPQDRLFLVPGTEVAIWQCPNEDYSPPSPVPSLPHHILIKVLAPFESLDYLHRLLFVMVSILIAVILALVSERLKDKESQRAMHSAQARMCFTSSETSCIFL